MKKLNEATVIERLKAYHDERVTDELYDFGKMLMAEMIDRNKGLETKAASMAAYSIGIITLLASTFGIWSHKVHSILVPLPVFAGVLAFIATCFAIRALKLQTFEAITQSDWIKADCLDDREKLRRLHIINMWGVIDSHETVTERKARAIGRAQWALFFASAALVISLLDAVVVFGFSIGIAFARW